MQRAFELELKSIDDEGSFEGWASTYDVDEVGDQVMPGAFTKTLSASKSRPLLADHRDAIGSVDLSENPMGLHAKGKLTLEVQKAREFHALLKSGGVKGLSIGFQTVKSDYNGDVRQLKELKLYEVSLTAIPANQNAQVFSVKSGDLDRIRSAYSDFRTGILSALGTKAGSSGELTKRVDGEDLPSRAFAFVGDEKDTSTWKLPLFFSDPEKTKSHIRNALSRFGQTTGIPQSEKPRVLSRIHAAARQHGIGNY